MLMKALSM